jgi:hypothetical protein
MMRKGKTVHGARHVDIGKQHMDAGGMGLKDIQGRIGMFGLHYLEAFILQRIDDDHADQFLVLGHENKNLGRHRLFSPACELNRGQSLPVATLLGL